MSFELCKPFTLKVSENILSKIHFLIKTVIFRFVQKRSFNYALTKSGKIIYNLNQSKTTKEKLK